MDGTALIRSDADPGAPPRMFRAQIRFRLWGSLGSSLEHPTPSTGGLNRLTLKYYKVALQRFHEESAPQR